jgi:hypothetical protein
VTPDGEGRTLAEAADFFLQLSNEGETQ